MNVAMTDESCGVQYAAISHWHKEDQTVLPPTYLPGKDTDCLGHSLVEVLEQN